ncbi:MAG: DUF2510 domain-containing protein [Propionibacteriaceae bacterium]|jgi:hypothetical protein|nr:DUF2510 domain-containing protein [Propionibacteriaceae bacterium]
MALKGWYPDPGGQPGRFRYWDGSGWSATTTTNPHSAPPPTPATNQGNERQRSRDRGWLYALIVLALATVVTMVFVITRSGTPNRTSATEDTNSAKPTVSGWDETSTPTPPPTLTAPGGGDLVSCPFTRNTSNTTQRGNTLRSGNVVVDRTPDWIMRDMYLEFSYDRHFQTYILYESQFRQWMADIGVASLAIEDGFVDIRTSAEQAMQCLASSEYYEGFTGRVDLKSEQIEISGHPAWHLRAEILVDDVYFPNVEGDVTDIVVIDLGPSSDHLGLYTASCTIGDAYTCDAIDKAITTLRVED